MQRDLGIGLAEFLKVTCLSLIHHFLTQFSIRSGYDAGKLIITETLCDLILRQIL